MNHINKLFCLYVSNILDKNWYKLDTTALLLEFPIKQLNRESFITVISNSIDLCYWLYTNYSNYDYMDTFHIDTNKIYSINKSEHIYFIDNTFLLVQESDSIPTFKVEEYNIIKLIHPLVLDIIHYNKDLDTLSLEELKTVFNFNKLIIL